MKRHNRIFAVVLSLCMIMALAPTLASNAAESPVSSVWDGTVATSFAGGTGTEESPFLIATGEQLAYLAQTVNNGNAYAGQYLKLTANILLNDTTDWENWGTTPPANAWTAIGTYTDSSTYSPFSGNFNGDGFAVRGIYINKTGTTETSTDSSQGLFGYCRGDDSVNPVISNVGVALSYIHGYKAVGGVVGYHYAYGCTATISNCYNNGTVSGNGYVGGVAGLNYTYRQYAYSSDANATISNCYNNGTISGKSDVGGVVGGNYTNATHSITLIINCFNNGTVSGNTYVGGVAGINYTEAAGTATISNCYNTGAVGGGNDVGGVVGSNYTGYTSAVTTIRNCYDTGTISGKSYVGGVAGSNCAINTAARAVIENCYFLETCGVSVGATNYGTGTETISNVIALTDAALRVQSNYAGFDFTATWTMDGNPEYPYAELVSLPHVFKTHPVSYYADGVLVTAYDVIEGKTLAEIPSVPAKEGYDQTAPYWDIDLTGVAITQEYTVNAVYTINTYKVTYVADGVTVGEYTVDWNATLSEIPAVPEKEGYTGAWDIDLTGVAITQEYTVNAVYTYTGILGDVNLDKAVTSADASALLRYVVGLDKLSKEALLTANVNGDTAVTSADASVILRYVVGLIHNFSEAAD